MEYFLFTFSEAHHVVTQLQEMETCINSLNDQYDAERKYLDSLENDLVRASIATRELR